VAIMVTDPRNNLLSQLTAVGQQYLAGKQQERMSGLDFANKKTLIELMDRLGGANDTREFEQNKELATLTQANNLGLLDAAGKTRLAELEMTTGSNERIAQIGATGAVNAAKAGQPASGASSIEQLTALVSLLRPPAEQGTSPYIPEPLNVPQQQRAGISTPGGRQPLGSPNIGFGLLGNLFANSGESGAAATGASLLAQIQTNADNPTALRAIQSQILSGEVDGLDTVRKRELLDILDRRATELEKVGTNTQKRDLMMGDVAGAAQILQLLK